jgi:Fe2+ or Zn2+ uptake regulation protein
VRDKLYQIAQKLLQSPKRLTRQAMLQGLQAQAPGVSLARAERGLEMLLEVGAVKEQAGTYTLQE